MTLSPYALKYDEMALLGPLSVMHFRRYSLVSRFNDHMETRLLVKRCILRFQNSSSSRPGTTIVFEKVFTSPSAVHSSWTFYVLRRVHSLSGMTLESQKGLSAQSGDCYDREKIGLKNDRLLICCP